MHQPVQLTASVIRFEPLPLFPRGAERIEPTESEFVVMRLSDLARAISERDLSRVQPDIAEISGVDFENATFVMNRTFRDQPYFSHQKTDVHVWQRNVSLYVNRMVKRHIWRKIFADCERSIGAHWEIDI